MNTKRRTAAICSSVICVLILGCSLVQMGGSTSTSKLLTSEQISTVQLDSLLFQAGDLPAKYTGAPPTTTVPDRFQKLPTAQKQSSEQISQNGSWVGDVTVFLYEKQADIDQAFLSYTGKKISEAEAVPEMGEKSVFTPFSIPYSGGSIDGAEVMFVRCSAIVNVRLITYENNEVSAFAKQLDKRLAPVVCNNSANSAPEVSAAGFGVPVTNGKWEITLTKVREEAQLSGSSGTRYTPESGYTFLVADVTIRNLDSSQETKFSADAVRVVDVDGEQFENVGSGFGMMYSLGGEATYSNDQGDTLKLGLVFSVKKTSISREFKLQFMDCPPIPFTVSGLSQTVEPSPVVATAPTVTPTSAPLEPKSPPAVTGVFSAEVPGHAVWANTGINVTAGQTLNFSAVGIVNTYGGGEGSDSNPDGQTVNCQPVEDNSNCIINGAPYGLLVGKIGEGAPFRIGANLEIVVPASGTLYLMVNDNYSHYEDNFGSYQVTIILR